MMGTANDIQSEEQDQKLPEFVFANNEDGIVSFKYLNALEALKDGLLSGRYGATEDLMREVYLTSQKLVCENMMLRDRLSKAQSEILRILFNQNRVNLAGR